MASVLDFLDGKKTYLFLIVFAALGIFAPEGTVAGIDLPKNLPELTLAAALAALRAGVSKSG